LLRLLLLLLLLGVVVGGAAGVVGGGMLGVEGVEVGVVGVGGRAAVWGVVGRRGLVCFVVVGWG
jgi:hypothetical protein